MKRKLFPIFTLIILLAQSYSPLLFTVLASIEPSVENETQVEATLPATEAPVDPTETTEPTATEEPTAILTDEPTTEVTEEPTVTPTDEDTIGEILDGISTERPEVVPTPYKNSLLPLKLANGFEVEILENTLADSIDEDAVTVASDGSAVLTTDKADYAPTDTVLLTGNGFLANTSYIIEITSETGNYLFSDVVVTDSKGELVYTHQLDGTYRPFYHAEVKDSSGRVVAFVDFTDSRVINSVTLNGGSSVSVAPNSTISATVNVTTDGSGSNNNWECTSWRIGNSGSYTKVNHDNKGSSGSHDFTFNITAPSSIGTYDVSFIAYSDDNCNNGASQPLVLTNAVTVLPPIANPTLPQACGLDIALVIDNSTSISSSEMTQIKSAMTAFTNALDGTPTWFSVTRFATTASVSQSFTSNISLVNTAINNIPVGGGFTNWQDGFVKAQSTFDPRVSKPNLVIFASDGNPNRTGVSGTTVTESVAVADAKVIADSLKTSGVRVLAIGVGSDLNTANMIEISGPNVNTGNVLTSDVITSDFTELAADLAEFASQTCGGTISVNKYIGSVAEANRAGTGWEFNVAGTTKTTDSNGQTDAVEVAPGSNYSVVESNILTGYSFDSAVCKNQAGQNVGSSITNGVGSITISDSDIISCDFVNNDMPTLTVNKVLNPVGHGEFNLLIDGQSYANGVGNGGTTEAIALAPGSYVVSEVASNPSTNLSEYKITYSGDCDSQGSVTLNEGDNKTCTITNIAYATVTITKDVVPDDSSLWDFTLNGTGGNFSKNDLGNNQSYTFLNLVPGSYNLTELSDPDYKTNIVCDNIPGLPGSNGYLLSLSAGQSTQCTITNTLQTGDIQIVKNTIGGNNEFSFETSTLPGGNFDLTTVAGTAKKDFNGIIAGTYGAKEIVPAGWDLTGLVCVDPDQGSKVDINTGIATIDLDAGESITCTFTNTQRGSITAHKFQDDDLNMQQGSGEVDLKDWQMTLYKGSGCVADDLISSSTTNTDGDVLFSNLVPGSYSVRETLQSGYLNTTPLCQNVTIDAGEADTANFGNYILGEITVCKYNDTNADGLTTGDSKLAGWTINLEGPSDYDESKVTGENGCVTFDDLKYGRYTYSEDLKDGWVETKPAGGKAYTVSVDADSLTHNLVLTNYAYGSISGMKFEDLNDNGVKDPSEPGLKDWTINLDKNADESVDATTKTDENGNYTFTNLEYGTYRVRETQQNGWKQTTTNPLDINISSGVDSTGNDFGNFEYGSVEVWKYEDMDFNLGKGINDPYLGNPTFTFRLYEDSGTLWNLIATESTDGTGKAEFIDVLESLGNYYICEVKKDGWEDMRSLNNPANNESGATDEYHVCEGITVNESGYSVSTEFGNVELGEIFGFKWNDINGNKERDCEFVSDRIEASAVVPQLCEPLLSNWKIFIDENDNSVHDEGEDSILTDGQGEYAFENLLPGTYTICEVEQSGWYRTYPTETNCQDVQIGTDGDTEEANFGNYEAGTISGWKYRDVNGNGELDWEEREAEDKVNKLNDWTINLYNSDWEIVKSMETGDDETEAGNVYKGQFKFINLEMGNYYVCEELKEGWIQTEPREMLEFKPVELELEIQNNCYPVKIYESGQDISRLYFGNFEFGKVEGYKWDDLDGDGEWDEDEKGLENWTINITKIEELNEPIEERLLSSEIEVMEELTTKTDEDGYYEFEGLTAGVYRVCEEQQDGWMQTAPFQSEVGATILLDEEEDKYDGCWTFVVESGTEEGVNFGNFKLGMIEGYKWNDLDGDGVKDPEEPKLSDWEIQLWDEKLPEEAEEIEDKVEDKNVGVALLVGEPGNKIGSPIKTDSDGNFIFKDLEPGVYYVSEVLKSG